MEEKTENSISPNHADKSTDLIQRSILSDSFISNVLPVSEKVQKLIPVESSSIQTIGSVCIKSEESENVFNKLTLETSQLVVPILASSQNRPFADLDDCVSMMQKLRVADTPARKPPPKKEFPKKDAIYNFMPILKSSFELEESKAINSSYTSNNADGIVFDKIDEPSKAESDMWHDCNDSSTIETTYYEDKDESDVVIRPTAQPDFTLNMNDGDHCSPLNVIYSDDLGGEEIVDSGKTADNNEKFEQRTTNSPPLVKSSHHVIYWDEVDENSDPSTFVQPLYKSCKFEESTITSSLLDINDCVSVKGTTETDENLLEENTNCVSSNVEDSKVVEDMSNSLVVNLKLVNDSANEESDRSNLTGDFCKDLEDAVELEDSNNFNNIFFKSIDKPAREVVETSANEVADLGSESLIESSTIEKKDETNDSDGTFKEYNSHNSNPEESVIDGTSPRMTDLPALVRSSCRMIDWDNLDENSDPTALLDDSFKDLKEDVIHTEPICKKDEVIIFSCYKDQNVNGVKEVNFEEEEVSRLLIESSEVETEDLAGNCENISEENTVDECSNVKEFEEDTDARLTNSPPLVRTSNRVINWNNIDENSDPLSLLKEHPKDSENIARAEREELQVANVSDKMFDNVPQENNLEEEKTESFKIEVKDQADGSDHLSEKNVCDLELKTKPIITNSPHLKRSSNHVIDCDNFDENSDPSVVQLKSSFKFHEKENEEGNACKDEVSNSVRSNDCETVESPTVTIKNMADDPENPAEENILEADDRKVEDAEVAGNLPSSELHERGSKDDEHHTHPITLSSTGNVDFQQNISDAEGSLHPLASISEDAFKSTKDLELNDEDDFFLDSKEVFGNPANLDILEKYGSKMAGASKLTRQSLYVKFDPLVTKANLPEKETVNFSMLICSNINSSDDLMLMGTPPPNKVPLKAIPRVKDISPKEIDKFFDSSPQMEVQHRQMKQSSDEDATRMMKEMELNFQAQMLLKDQKFEAMAHEKDKKFEEREREFHAQLSDQNKKLEAVAYEFQAQLCEKDMKFEEREHEFLAKLLDQNKKLETVEQECLKREESCTGQFNTLNSQVEEFRLAASMYEGFFEQALAGGIKEKENFMKLKEELVLDKEQAIEDLQAIERSFSELHNRYEKLKIVTQNYQANEEVLKKCILEYQDAMKVGESKRMNLKKEAHEKLNLANEELMKLRKSIENEKSIHQATLRKSEMQIRSLEQSLEQKVKECNELTGICDELLTRVGE